MSWEGVLLIVVLRSLMPGAPNYLNWNTSGDPWVMFKLEGEIGYLVGFKLPVNKDLSFFVDFPRPEGLWRRVPWPQRVCLRWVGRNGGDCFIAILGLGSWILGGKDTKFLLPAFHNFLKFFLLKATVGNGITFGVWDEELVRGVWGCIW